MRLVSGDRAGALAVYEESLAIMRKLAEADPGNAGRVRDVSVYVEKIGDVYIVCRRPGQGRSPAYEESLAPAAGWPRPTPATPNGSAT